MLAMVIMLSASLRLRFRLVRIMLKNSVGYR